MLDVSKKFKEEQQNLLERRQNKAYKDMLRNEAKLGYETFMKIVNEFFDVYKYEKRGDTFNVVCTAPNEFKLHCIISKLRRSLLNDGTIESPDRDGLSYMRGLGTGEYYRGQPYQSPSLKQSEIDNDIQELKNDEQLLRIAKTIHPNANISVQKSSDSIHGLHYSAYLSIPLHRDQLYDHEFVKNIGYIFDQKPSTDFDAI